MSRSTGSNYHRDLHEYQLSVQLFAPLRLSSELDRRTERVIKANSGGSDHFTDITLHGDRQRGGIVVDYFVKASSLESAQRVGHVYLSQLCDLLSAVTECPVQFFANRDEATEQRVRDQRSPMRNARTLSSDEWSWVTGSLAAMRREHPRYLAAASWFRKGLIGDDCLDQFCCFFRTVERIAASYCDRSGWAEDEKGVRREIAQLTTDLFAKCETPELLADEQRVKQVVKLRNDISHGNEPITVDMIEMANAELLPLREAAFEVLDCLRKHGLMFHN